MRKLLILLGLLLMLPVAAQAQGTTIFGGYSYVRLDNTSTTPATKINTHGWDASLTQNMFKVIGVTADFGQSYATIAGVSAKQTTFLFGPEVHFPTTISPFAHALFGAARASSGGTSNITFSSALGGGVDLHAGHFLGLRLIQADYLYTHFGGVRQNDIRLAAGILLRF